MGLICANFYGGMEGKFIILIGGSYEKEDMYRRSHGIR